MQTNRTMRSFLKISIVLVCVFMFTNKLFAQVISNNGAGISITNGTFVNTDSVQNTAGTLTNDGTFNLSGTYINTGTTNGDGRFNIGGDWTNTNIFIPGTSTVRFNGTNFQRITSAGGETFYHLIISNSGIGLTNRIILSNDVTVSDSLDLNLGNVETGANILFLSDSTSASLKYTSLSGSRVIGKFERGVNAATNYLFPVGSDLNYNPLNLTPNVVPTAGSILSEFIASDPDSIGLPLPDAGYLNPADSVEVYDADSIGYWSLIAYNGFTTNDFNINLDGTGFTIPDQNATRIIKRTAIGNWTLDGKHKDAINSVAYRDTLTGGISNLGHHFGWGHIRPRIQTQPADTAVCDGESASFSVVATGRGELNYEWEVLERSGGWQEITDDAIYDNYDTDTLLIIVADTSMNGYKYRVIITDSLENFKRSNSQATLTVNPIPVVTATPQQDTICNGATTHIVLSSTELNTSYFIEILNPLNSIDGDTIILDGDIIKDILTNPTLFADSVVYRIVPYGPFSTQCEGIADTVVIWVEPTVVITASNDTICDNTFTSLTVSSENITTNGMRFTWIVTLNANINGEVNSDAVGLNMEDDIIQSLDNTTLVAQMVTYTITPWTIDAGGNNKCSGTPIDIDIWVEPTVTINAMSDTLCDSTATNIVVTSPNTTTNEIRYTWTFVPNLNIIGQDTYIGDGQIIGSAIIQNLVNTSDSKQLVQYVITPWTVNASDNNECTDAAEVITIDIWVNPTPQVNISILDDIICNDTYTEITLTTPSILTSGVVTFDYISDADGGLTGNSSDNNLIHNDNIADLLHNNTAFPAYPLVVRYSITPKGTAIGCADGPTKTDSVTVHPTADTKMIADSVVCYLESNGRAIVEAENGINEFTYNWDDPLSQTDSLATGLPIGWYTVTVTDNQSCTKIDSVLIEQPDRLIPVIDTVRNVSCFGIGDAYIILNPTGGNSGYIYSWSNGESTDSIGGLNGGFIYVTVSDWKACTQDTVMEVDEPPQIAMDVSAHHVTCNGENDGWAEVQVVGLDLIEWSTGETTAIITNLNPGIYTVTASNIEGCRSIGSTEIREPEILEIDSINSTRISCAGDDDGTLNLFAVGGNNIDFHNNDSPLPYTYTWFTSDGTGLVTNEGDQTGLSGGTYYITVSDELGCAANDSAIVQGPLTFESYTVTTDVTCFEDDDGSIDLIVSGGNNESDYTYYWETSNGEVLDTISEDQTNLSGGDYFVTITDANNCEILNSAIIVEPDQLETFITETNISCFGYEDGTAKIDIDGGNGENVIVWSGNPIGQNTDSIYGLSSGLYTVTVNDIENCLTSNSVEITQPEQIETNIFSSNITCFGFSNGVISLNPTGGTIPYNYLWSHDASLDTNIAPGLWPGNYNIDILDANNCIESASIDITQPDRLEFDPTTYSDDITCYGEDDGYIFLNIGGGTPDYNYTWSTGVSGITIDITSEDMLTAGMYRIDISDLQNCQIDTTIKIIEPDKLIISPVLRKPTCADISDGSIELNITGGRTQNNEYNIYWDNGNAEENLYDIRSGIYKVQIIDSSDCAIDTTFRLQSAFAFCINIPSAFSPNGDNINEKWEIDMSLYPNAEIEIFDRFGKRIFFSKGYEESQYWDGSLNGKELPMDAYYYIIYLKNGSGRISGSVTLLR